MKRLSSILAVALLSIGPLWADTLYQTSAQGRQVVIQRNAIVVKEDSSSLVYKHFDLRERRVVKVRLNKGTLDYSVVISGQPERQQIVENWKRFGYKASVTDQAGKTTRVFDAYIDFYPPGGRGSLLESFPPRTSLTLLRDDGGVDDLEFAKIQRVEFLGNQMKAILPDGQVKSGQFLKPIDQPVEPRLLGITEHYNPASEEVFDFSLPLTQLKEIRFDP